MNKKFSLRSFCIGLGVVFACVNPSYAQTEGVEYSVIAPLAQQSLLLDGMKVGNKMVVVGARGHILISDDGGNSWKQAQVPARVTLTGVYFADEKYGWAVGHDAIILRTEDGGQNWELVYRAPEEERPLLDIWFEQDARVGYALGAYGYRLKSIDGGRTWEELGIGDPDEPDDSHLNEVAESDSGTMYIAAEAGAAYRSDDRGENWDKIYPPYEGSFFGVLPLLNDSLLMFGLQGNVFRSEDAGENWSKIPVASTATLNSGAILADGTIVIVGNEGVYLVSKSGGRSFKQNVLADRMSIANIIPTDDGGALLIGEAGVRKLAKQEFK